MCNINNKLYLETIMSNLIKVELFQKLKKRFSIGHAILEGIHKCNREKIYILLTDKFEEKRKGFFLSKYL